MDAIEDMILDSDESDDDVETEILTKNEMIVLLQSRKRSRNPSTLRQLAIKHISRNIEFWYDYIPQDSGKYLYVLSPLDCLSELIIFLNTLLDARVLRPCKMFKYMIIDSVSV